MKKRIISAVLAVSFFALSAAHNAPYRAADAKFKAILPGYEVIDSDILTYWDVCSRNGARIAERVKWTVGRQPEGFYVDPSELGLGDLPEGTRMVSYFAYNPDTNFSDDYTGIYSFVIE